MVEMQDSLKDVSEHMCALGLGALRHANWHANYWSPENDHWSELSVIQAAHAAEILIKARIAEEHPLLIFENFPKRQNTNSPLALEHLIQGGRTYQYMDLPDRLWATTGLTLSNPDLFKKFGALRNQIQHFAAPPRSVTKDAIEFIYGVIDPFINQCWGLFAVDYNEDHEPYLHLVPNIIQHGVSFLVSPDMVNVVDDMEITWPEDNPAYKTEMLSRFQAEKLKKISA